MQVLASRLLFLANRNAGQAIPPLFWPVNCIKIGGRVALLSDPTVNCLYCGSAQCAKQQGKASGITHERVSTSFHEADLDPVSALLKNEACVVVYKYPPLPPGGCELLLP